MDKYFQKYRDNVIGADFYFDSPFGRQKILYADWTASGRLYKPIEDYLMQNIYPLIGNTHTDTTITGKTMTRFYKEALAHIKQHVNANGDDVIISAGSGMTGVVNKLQRILGLRIHEKYLRELEIPYKDKPVVFITHMEHHSNHTSWLQTTAIVEIIPQNHIGLPCLNEFEKLLEKHKNRKLKIAAITSCSNVTGIITPYYEVSKLVHKYGGYCFVDFACSAPYIEIDMHPEDKDSALDAIFFSPHKFLGGPGSSGVVIFNKKLYTNRIPDNPGGGTVNWTSPWDEHLFVDDIEEREDGGTPPFLQTIRTSLSIKLKEEIGTDRIQQREKEIGSYFTEKLKDIKGAHLLHDNITDRLCIFSIAFDDLHYNLVVRLLNDLYGIQTRGGCSCAGTYGHYLLNMHPDISRVLRSEVTCGDLSRKPGWVRVSLHPIMSNKEIDFIANSISDILKHKSQYIPYYKYNSSNNEWYHIGEVESKSFNKTAI